MRSSSAVIDTIDQIISDGVSREILHVYTEDEKFFQSEITVKGRKLINFGSCSYLGLEFDSRLIEASKKAIEHYGTQFAASRAYVSMGLYQELEDLFRQIFDAPCVITPTTTLGHICNIPVLVTSSDLVITDQQVHNTVNTAVKLTLSSGTDSEIIRHNRMDLLEERIKSRRNNYQKIWYMADGIYSMFGDMAPIDELYRLLDHYPNFHIYVDDAHGMGVMGKHGRGSVLNNRHFHPKMVMATSLAKAFATGGAVMVYPNAEMARRVRSCGAPLMNSGPLQPAQLGAAVACARIHLTDEIYQLQSELQERIKFTNLLLRKYELPLIAENNSPVFFVGAQIPKVGYKVIQRMLERGFYLNLGIFPVVPMKNTGIRFTITRLHSFSQIESMISILSKELPKALQEEGLGYKDVYKAFRLPIPAEQKLDHSYASVINQALSLKANHYKSILDISRQEWDDMFANKGSFDWNGLALLENSFQNNTEKENNWQFDYFIINDIESGRPVLASFITTSTWKDDMLSPSSVSEIVEEHRRKVDPYYLTSITVSTGSLITEGEHLFLDRQSPFWKDALRLFFDKLSALQEGYGAGNIVIRDFNVVDEELERVLIDHGYFRFSMPENHIIHNLDFDSETSYYQKLSRKSKEHFRKHIRNHKEQFVTRVEKDPGEQVIDHWYRLYMNVKEHSMELNTYPLPRKLFSNLVASDDWEVLALYIRDDKEEYKNVAVVFCHKAGDCYIPVVIGLDYDYISKYEVYRQALFQIVMRARNIGKTSVHLGFSASIEKKKLGAKAHPTFGFMQTKDNYNVETLVNINQAVKTRK